MIDRTVVRQWEGNHKTGISGEPSVVAQWEESKALHVAPGKTEFDCYSPGEFKHIKEKTRMIYAYTKRFALTALQHTVHPCMGLALFNQDGCLLRLFGKEGFLDWAKEQGFCHGSKWDLASIGCSAVSLGLASKQPVTTVGDANYAKLLLNTCLYFVPFEHYITETNYINDEHFTGGLAIITPYQEKPQDYLLLAASVAMDIALHSFMTNSLNRTYAKESLALVTIDSDVTTGKSNLLYHNMNVFQTFGIPYQSLYLTDATRLFDPLPANQRLWNIINQRETVSNESLNLSVQGKEGDYILSTVTYDQPLLAIRGMRLYIDKEQKISAYISKHIGNNAQLTFRNIIGQSECFSCATEHAKKIALSDNNVLILGESGVGKDIFAQAIHNSSSRGARPFIAVNCAAFPRDLFASELFGYSEGAFTGSKRGGNIGKFELANTGTLFLDEVGDIPLDLQASLLRIIEQKAFMKLGSTKQTQLDIKIIAATNADLRQKVRDRLFREDLYYRLCGLRLLVPPLRNRGDDVILLAHHFAGSAAAKIQMSPPKIPPETEAFLREYAWSGNVRELQNVIGSSIQIYHPTVLYPHHFAQILDYDVSAALPTEKPIPVSTGYAPRRSTTQALPEKEELLQALEVHHYNRSKAAEALGISRRSLYRLLDKYHIELS